MKKYKSLLGTVVGTMITGFAIGVFLTPNKIVGGGVSGISTILYHTLRVPPGLSMIVINVLLLLIGLGVLGKEFTIKTLIGSAAISFFSQIFSYIPFYTDNTILAVLFGGVLYGLGIGIAFASGASTGGTDILGRLIQSKLPTVPIGKMVLVVDSVIILISLIIFKNLELTLFGIISLFITSYSIDFVIASLNVSRIAFVITSKGEEISKYLVNTSPRGVTVIDATGAYTNTKKQMLFCALKEVESLEFQNKILEIDSEAFIVFSESQRIKGNGFTLYV